MMKKIVNKIAKMINNKKINNQSLPINLWSSAMLNVFVKYNSMHLFITDRLLAYHVTLLNILCIKWENLIEMSLEIFMSFIC